MFRAQRFVGAAANFTTWVQEQFQRVERASLEPVDFLTLIDTTREPEKPRAGQVIFTSGEWNPGSGAGVYVFYGSTWNKLG